jgi:hypothetical protein
LSDLEQCAADLITVPDANGIVRQSFDREVLAELSVDEIGRRSSDYNPTPMLASVIVSPIHRPTIAHAEIVAVNAAAA